VRPLYLDGGVVAFLHEPAAPSHGPAVLFVPPFGWEDVCSYRARRDWAEHLAAGGRPVLRFDLPGTGDSAGSPDDAGLVDAWTDTVAAAARLLATTSDRVAAVGLGLGGMLAWRAAAAGAPIDELVLWGTPARGSALVRELRAFARFETATIVAAGAPEPPPGDLAPGGYRLTGETIAAIAELDLTELPLRDVRVLLLDRDGVGVDEALARDATVVRGDGWGAMMVRPDESRPPSEVFDLVDDWLGAGAAAAPETNRAVALVSPGVREEVVALTDDELVGVLATADEPTDSDLAVVLVNAAAVRRSGPSRLWTDLARGFAASGVPSLRVDLAGIGDSPGDGSRYHEVAPLYTPIFVRQVRAVLDELEHVLPAQRFVVLGLCSGAYWAFHAALEDPRVAAAVLLNGRLLFWDDTLERERDLRSIRRRMLTPFYWRRLLRGDFSFGPRRALAALAAPLVRPRAAAETDRALDRLRETGKRVTFVFCDGEPLRDELERTGRLHDRVRWPNVDVELVPGRDHTFRPLWMQPHVRAAVERAVSAAAVDRDR
jgi:pimeloyl-ACP methyl ester carboxylesterase